MLKKENRYQFRQRMLEQHEKNLRDFNKTPQADELEIKNGFTVKLAPDADEVILTAARDFVDFLFTSMGVSAMISYGSTNAEANQLAVFTKKDKSLDPGEGEGYRGYRLDASEGIEICGCDARGAALAIYDLEKEMARIRAPFIKKGTVSKKPLFSPQMVHSGYGLDQYPNEHLAAIAREGRDAILVFTKGLNMIPSGFLDFNELIYRAERYGIDVYAYSYIKSIYHPDDEAAESYYEQSYGALFKNCPKLKGVILVGESIGFPTKDENSCTAPVVDGIPTGKLSSCMWPCTDYPQFLEMLQRVIYKYKADADIVFWTYNWGSQPAEDRLRLIRSLPKDISLLVTYEMFELIPLYDATQCCTDYTLTFAGPGQYFISEAQAAKECGLRLYAMTNTGGLTWDFGTIPYQPAPHQWIKRCEGLREAHDKWGLCGIMESHHYGFYPSFISKLTQGCLTSPGESCENILMDCLEREYGAECAEDLEQALRFWSEAAIYDTPSYADQYGPMRIGPAFPLCLHMISTPPAAPHAMFGNRICHAGYAIDSSAQGSHPSVRLPREIKSLTEMKRLMEQGLELMEKIKNPNTALLRLINLGKYMICTIQTVINVKKWYTLKMELNCAGHCAELLAITDKMKEIAYDEIKNTESAIPLVQADSRLGWEPSMEYIGDEPQLRWKIRQVNYVLDHELPYLIKSMRF